ncbi:multiple inositol polyphosphate phosphatase 1 isoform X2 [Anabrus simplex]|uniref:multiple inositol polyphosphate phosphatase 1 isoform X2 n=1 Tax=Anabrus simplex TaxID=316456 RepID=UPI0035A2B2B5
MAGKMLILCLILQYVWSSLGDLQCQERFVHYGHHLGTKSAYRFPLQPPKITEPGLCRDDVALKTWRPRLKETDEKKLSAIGEDEMIQLAQNYRYYFPDLFPGNYSAASYLFRYTATQRTSASARAFAVGLFGRGTSHHVRYPPAVKKDAVLRFYKLCKRWRKQIHDNPDAVEERRKFEAGSEMLYTLTTISKRLNLNFTLSLEDVKLMYVTCAFETALYPREKSPWCAAFSEENLRVMEFAEDLEYYWIDGYGHNITYEQACPAIRDMALRIIPSLIQPGTPPTTVYFTHSGALLKMLSRLGLYKDRGGLTHDRYHSLHSRLWKVSNIDIFGSNLAFVLSRCFDGYYVLTLHQEKIVRLPGCDQDEDLCPLNLFLKLMWDIVSGCNFEKLCSLRDV